MAARTAAAARRPGAPATRITAGVWRGRVVDTPRGMEVRPTSALVRQALFDILGTTVRDAVVVDLFAGAGTVGFEALSRGAARVVAVERDRATAALIAGTAERLGCADRLRVIPADVVRWLGSAPRDIAAADLVFLDAPYRDDAVVTVLDLLGASPVRRVVCEHHRARRLPPRIGHLEVAREARYGTTQLTFYLSRPEPGTAPGDREEPPPA